MRKAIKFLKNIFDPKSNLYSILLGSMSFLAILISLLTLKEMKVQRELSMMPIARVQSFENVYIHVDSSCQDMIYNDEINVHKSFDNQSENPEFTNEKISDWFVLSLINIGEGSAIDIEVEWNINYKWFQEYFADLKIDEDIFKFTLDNQNIFVVNKNCSNIKSGKSAPTLSKITYSHLLSASNSSERIKINIPELILKLQVAAIKGAWLGEGQNAENLTSIPVEHQFKIKYNSVNGLEYQDTYKASVSLTSPLIETQMKSGKETIFSASYNNFIVEFIVEKLP